MVKNNNLTITILAGGLGKRMKSPLPKVLHVVRGRPMLVTIIEESLKLNPSKILIVVGQYKPIIEQTLDEWNLLDKINFTIQDPALGTGHAVLCTLEQLSSSPDDYNIILNGDSPLLSCTTISEILSVFANSDKDIQITSISLDNPFGSGRILKINDKFSRIVEEKDCSELERQINEVNIGIYVAKNNVLKKYIPQIKNNNSQKEYYLTTLVEIYLENETKDVGLIELDKSKLVEISNVNTIEELDKLNKI